MTTSRTAFSGISRVSFLGPVPSIETLPLQFANYSRRGFYCLGTNAHVGAIVDSVGRDEVGLCHSLRNFYDQHDFIIDALQE